MEKKKFPYTASIVIAILLIIANAAYLLFKLGQKSGYDEKWKDYDDYGWS